MVIRLALVFGIGTGICSCCVFATVVFGVSAFGFHCALAFETGFGSGKENACCVGIGICMHVGLGVCSCKLHVHVHVHFGINERVSVSLLLLATPQLRPANPKKPKRCPPGQRLSDGYRCTRNAHGSMRCGIKTRPRTTTTTS